MKVRTLFISDVHMGTGHCNHEKLLKLLSEVECEYLYLVGDIVDGWALQRRFKWHNNYNTIIQKILRMSRKGTQVVYLYGNHDDFLQSFDNFNFGENIVIKREIGHITAKNQKLLILHGDQFDGIVSNHRWIQHIGAAIYDISLSLNVFFKIFKFSLSKFLKNKAKEAVNYIGSYENVVANYCKLNCYDGIVCGHIHVPIIKTIQNIEYYNIGDMLEHNTVLVETLEGDIKLLQL